MDAGKQLFSESKKHARKGAEKANQVYKDQVDKHWPSIKPHYDEYVVGNFQKHVAPHLQQHVYPRLEQLSKWYKQDVVPRFQQAVKNIEQGYQRMVQLYGEECRSSLKAYKKARKENDFLKEHALPKAVVETWTHSCSHADETMESAIYGLLLLLGVIFHRRILGLAWWTLNLVLTILVTFTPLRFFVSGKRRKPVKNDSSKNGEDDVAPVPDIASYSGSPDSVKSPGGAYKNARGAKKPTDTGSK